MPKRKEADFTVIVEGDKSRRYVTRMFDRGTEGVPAVYVWGRTDGDGLVVEGEVREDGLYLTVERQTVDGDLVRVYVCKVA